MHQLRDRRCRCTTQLEKPALETKPDRGAVVLTALRPAPGNMGIGMNDDPSWRDLIAANMREVNSFWSWRDKPIGEGGAAEEILRQCGVDVRNLVSRVQGQDPPDCEAILDGRFSGVEVTELVHEKTLRRSIKAVRQRQSGNEPKQGEAYFIWDRDDLLTGLQTLIDRKDEPSKQKGGPYERYVLVIHTDELVLDRDTVTRFLEGATFRAKMITDVFFGLSYERGCCPVFRLPLGDVRTPGIVDHEK
jgi:hypothetical protein